MFVMAYARASSWIRCVTMRILFVASVVTAFALYACSSDPADNAPAETPDAAQDAPTTPDSSEPVDAGKDAPDAADASTAPEAGCVRNPIADSNCSSQSRQAYLCQGDAGPVDAGPACDFFTGLDGQSLYCCDQL